MTDGKDLEAEIHPLKSENRKVPENAGGPAGKEPRKTPAPQTRLSRCRTAAFFLSLFACLLVVFVVSFIIPCPARLGASPRGHMRSSPRDRTPGVRAPSAGQRPAGLGQRLVSKETHRQPPIRVHRESSWVPALAPTP